MLELLRTQTKSGHPVVISLDTDGTEPRIFFSGAMPYHVGSLLLGANDPNDGWFYLDLGADYAVPQRAVDRAVSLATGPLRNSGHYRAVWIPNDPRDPF